MGEHTRFPPCLNKFHRPAPLLWQRVCQHSWPRLESWLPLSWELLLSIGLRSNRNIPHCSGGSGHHSHPQHRPEDIKVNAVSPSNMYILRTLKAFYTKGSCLLHILCTCFFLPTKPIRSWISTTAFTSALTDQLFRSKRWMTYCSSTSFPVLLSYITKFKKKKKILTKKTKTKLSQQRLKNCIDMRI